MATLFLLKTKHKVTRRSDRIAELCRIFALLADPTRLRILLVISERKRLCVSDLAENLGASLSNTSHQLRKLELAGLIESSRDGRTICYKPCQSLLVGAVLESVRFIKNYV
jgi:DNA-binding transcriptional ArsR family regulator